MNVNTNETTTIASNPGIAAEAAAIAAQASATATDATAAQVSTAAQTGTGMLAAAATGTTSGPKSAKTADASPATGTTQASTGLQPDASGGLGQTASGPDTTGTATAAQPAHSSAQKHDGPATGTEGNGAAGPDSPQASAPATTTPTHTVHASDTALQAPGQSIDASQQAASSASIQPQNVTTPTAQTPQYTVAAAAGAPVPLNGLAVQIAVTAQSGKSSFEIRLDPADLGRIDVRLNVDQQGQVTSHLTVEKPETLALLRQDAPQLQRALQDAGLKTGDGGLQFSLRDQSSSGQNARDDTGRNAHRLVVTEDDAMPASTAGRTYGRMLGSSSGLDIRV